MVIAHIDEKLPGVILDRHEFRGDATIVVGVESFLTVVDFLHDDGYQLLVDVTAVDWADRAEDQGGRFDVVYHWLNLNNQERLRLKVRVAEGASVPSLVSRFRTADWYEREVFDMFGVPFDGHPNLKRLLMWDDFQGHPLRKDFPLDGGDSFCTADTGTSYAGDACSLQG